MRTLVSNLTAALLLVHALVGCCRHHEHDHTASGHIEAVESLAATCCHDGDSFCVHDEEPAPAPSPCNCKLECMALCIYLPPEKYVVDAGDLLLSFDILPIGDACTGIEAAAASRCGDCKTTYWAWEPPLRLHLLHQIILI